jgi:hypothetical protein
LPVIKLHKTPLQQAATTPASVNNLSGLEADFLKPLNTITQRAKMSLKWLVVMTLLFAMLSNLSTAKQVMVKCEADWPSRSLEKCPYEGDEFRPESFSSRVVRTLLLSRTTATFSEIDTNIDEGMPNENNTTSNFASQIASEDPKDDVFHTKRDPTEEPAPTEEPVPIEEPSPTEEPGSTEEPTPTKEPVSSEEPVPTKEAAPTKEPLPTKKPEPTKAPVPPKEPAWPNKWTKRPCCQLSCACYKYLLGFGGTKKPAKMSKEWKKARCCYQQMLDDPNCANPPFFERFDVIQPPWCLR